MNISSSKYIYRLCLYIQMFICCFLITDVCFFHMLALAMFIHVTFEIDNIVLFKIRPGLVINKSLHQNQEQYVKLG